MKVLFIGATGIVGQRIVPSLAETFEMHPAAFDGGEVAGLSVHQVDIRDFEATHALIREIRPDAIVNCAIADYKEYQCVYDVEVAHRYHEASIDVNVRGAYHLYEAAARVGVRKFVFISSATVIKRHIEAGNLLTGAEPPRPFGIYACTKFFGEGTGEFYSGLHGMSVTCLRLGQPDPVPAWEQEKRLGDDAFRAMLVNFGDIAQAVQCALYETAPFTTYPIFSASDVSPVLPSATEPLGYSPRHYYSRDGVRLIE